MNTSLPSSDPGEQTQLSGRTPQSLWLGAATFLVAFLAVSPVSGALSDRSEPLPNDSTREIADYLIANPAAAIAVAVLQVLSVLGFALFVLKLTPHLRASGEGSVNRLPQIGLLSVAAMLMSSAIGVIGALVAPSVSAETVATLRQANFIAGGVVNVVTLGLFVFGASRVLRGAGRIGGVSAGLGYVAGGLGLLSILSLVFFYANALLPLGRILSMVWALSVAIVISRASRSARERPAGDHE